MCVTPNIWYNYVIIVFYICLFSGPPTPPSLDSGSVNLVAKYNYKSNPNRPGGFDEMSLAQGERLTFIAPHSLNPYWWQAKRENGECAYVPATYVMVKSLAIV